MSNENEGEGLSGFELLLARLLLGDGECSHAKHLNQVALMLLAAVIRHGGRMEFSDAELEDASKRMLAIHAEEARRSIVAEAMVPPIGEGKKPTHPTAPGAH